MSATSDGARDREEFYEQLTTELESFVSRRTSLDWDERTAIVQEAFSRFLERYPEKASVPGLEARKILFRIVENAIADWFRMTREVTLDADSGLPSNAKAQEGNPGAQTKPRRRVTSAVAQLPSTQRRVVHLRFWFGWSERRIARTMQESRHNVTVALGRALVNLRRALGG